MLAETTLIIPSSEHNCEESLHKITLYLERSSHCRSYLLTRHLAASEGYLLSCEWDSPIWRAIAWRYFTDLFARSDIGFYATLHAPDATKEPCS
ncbi:MAG TPA: hypothetical protein VKR06_03890 [Ktedonosporobacter sp.]|nr:hypothetical protein [Ktedonosporobacter sp.]